MNADVLCSVVTETAYSELDELVYELHVVFLEEGIFCIYVWKTAHALVSTLSAVIIVIDALKAICEEPRKLRADLALQEELLARLEEIYMLSEETLRI